MRTLLNRIPREDGLLFFLGLSLPWQTRVFTPAFLEHGIPWEEGTRAFYLSWIVLFAAFIVYGRTPSVPRRIFFGVGVFAIVNSIHSIDPMVSAYAWGLIFLLFGLVWFLSSLNSEQRAQVFRGLLFTIAVSTFFASIQVLQQRVTGSSWLGIAPQLTETRGVSVMLINGARWLRAYGIFPHPNIFGGWLVFGLALLTQPLFPYKTRLSLSAVFVLGLLLTASRSAFLAALILGLVIAKDDWREGLFSRLSRFRSIAAVLLIGFVIAPFAWSRISSRNGLEQRSINERVASLVQARGVLGEHMWFGTGLHAYRPALLKRCEGSCAFPVTSPHMVPLMLLTELGVIGFAGIFAGLWFVRSRFSLEWLALVPLLFLDHYLWSFWSGMLLFSLWISFFSTKEQAA